MTKEKKQKKKKSLSQVWREMPGKTFSFPWAGILGWLLRAFLVFLGTYAFTFFLGDATGLLTDGYVREGTVVAEQGRIALTAMLVALWGAAVAYNKITALCVPLLTAGGLAAYLFIPLAKVAPFQFAENSFRCTVNHALMSMASDGYTVMAGYCFSEEYAYKEIPMVTWAMCAVAVIIGLLLSLALQRKARPLLLGIVTACIAIPVFMYNITKTNKGTMLIIAFVAGALAVWFYDASFGVLAQEKARRNQRKADRRAEKTAKAEHKKALALSASDAMISAYDMGRTKREAKLAKARVYAQEKARLQAEKEAKKAELLEKKKQKKPETPKTKDKSLLLAQKKEKREQARAVRLAKHQTQTENRRNIAAGGFAGTATVLVALLALLIPNAAIENNFPIISLLDSKIRIARIYATAYLMGDDVDLNSLSLYGGVSELNPRTLSFNTPYFTGEKIFTVESGYNAPVYLRSWVGMNYDLETDTWTSADADTVIAYRGLFGRDFTSDTIGANFKKYTQPLSVDLTKYDQYRGYSKYGFLVAQTNILRVGGTSRLVFMPTYFYPTTGVMERGSFEQNKYAVSSYFDGVYSSRFFAVEGRAYSAYSFITTMKDPELGTTFDAQTEYFRISQVYANEVDTIEDIYNQRENGETSVTVTVDPETTAEMSEKLISELLNATAKATKEEALETFVTAYEKKMEEAGASWRGDSILRQYVAMTKEERSSYKFSYRLEEAYREYAYSLYRTPFGSEEIRNLALSLLKKKGWKYDSTLIDEEGNISPEFADSITDAHGVHITQHDLIKTVIEYLRSDDFTYTLTPTAPEEEYASALDAFLFGTKEGYCVHFATAAIAILREYGLAVRYDEGYLANGFQKTYAKEAVATYRTGVYDYDAHAWFEVYYPYMGWVQYEATPVYMSDMYDSGEGYSTTTSRNIPIGDMEEEIIEDDFTLESVEVKDYTLYIVLGVLLGVALLVAAVVLFFRYRANTSVKRRDKLLAEARDEQGYFSDRDNRTVTKSLNEAVMRLFRLLGYAPETGELHEEYAERIDKTFGALSRHKLTEILPLMEKEEFGNGLSFAELKILAEYYDELSAAVYRGLSLPRKFMMRCIYRAV